MGYKKIAIRAVSWVGLFRIFIRGSNLVKTAILARILTPQEFGVFGYSAIVLGLLEMFTETGINVFLVQENDPLIVKKYLNTSWVVSIMRGFAIASFIILSSPFITRFFSAPAALPLLILIALVPIIRGFINPAIVSFQKQLTFNREFWFRSVITLVDTAVTINSALILKNAFSLVLGLIIGALVEVILSLIYIYPKPKLIFDLSQFRHIIQRGKWITTSGIMSYFAGKIPDIAIGRLLSTSALGIYQMAYRVALVPIEELTESINRVAFPIYTKIVSDKTRVLKALIKNHLIMLTGAVPLSVLLFLFPKPITILLLGDQWSEVIPLIKTLSFVSLFVALGAPSNPFFLAIKKQEYLTILTFIRLILIALSIIPLVRLYGVLGAVIAFAFSAAITLPPRAFFLLRYFRSHSTSKNKEYYS